MIVRRPAVTTAAVEGRRAVAMAIYPATVTKARVNSPEPTFALWRLWHALAAIEEPALAAAAFGFRGSSGDRRRDGEGGDGGEQQFRHVNLLLGGSAPR